MSNANVGGLLRKARFALDLTLREVAEAVGVSIAYVNDIELGRREIAPKRVPEFAKALQLSEENVILLHQKTGVLPEGLLERLLKAPALWDVDLEKLGAEFGNLRSFLDDCGPSYLQAVVTPLGKTGNGKKSRGNSSNRKAVPRDVKSKGVASGRSAVSKRRKGARTRT